MSTVADEVVTWCDDIRKVLKIIKKPWDARHKLADELDRVRQNIQSLQSLLPVSEMTKLFNEFNAVRNVVGNAVNQTDPKVQKQQIKEAEPKFAEFDKKVREKLEIAQVLAEKKTAFQKQLQLDEIELNAMKKYQHLHQPLSALITRAKELGQAASFDLAMAKLEEFEKQLREKKKDKEKLDKEELEWLKKRPSAEQRLTELNDTLSQINTLPGVDMHIMAYYSLVTKIKNFLDSGKIKEAWEALEKANTLRTKDEIIGLSNKALESKRISSKDYADVHDDVVAAIDKLEDLVDDFVVSDYRKKVADYNRQIMNRRNAETAFESFKQLLTEVEELVKTATSQKQTAESNLPEISRMLKQLQEEFDSAEVSLLSIQQEKLLLLTTARDYESASTIAPKLYNDVLTTFQQMRDAKSVYDSMSSDIAKLKQSLEEVQKNWPGGNTRTGPILWEIISAEKLSTSDPNEAGNRITQAIEDFNELKRTHYEPYMALQAKREQWNLEIKRLVQTANEVASQLVLALKTYRSQNAIPSFDGVPDQPLDYAIIVQQCDHRWQAGQQSIHVESELQKLFEDVSGTLKDANSLLKNVKPTDLGDLAAAQARQESQIAYTRRLEELNNEIKALEAVSASDGRIYTQLKSKVERIAQSGDYSGAVTEAIKLTDEAKKRREEFTAKGGILETLRAEAQKLKAEVLRAYESLQKLLGKKFLRDSPYKPYLDKLKLEIDDLDALLIGNTQVAISRASLGYTKLKTRIADSATELKQLSDNSGGQPPPNQVKGFGTVNSLIQLLENVLKDPDLKELAKTKLEIYTKQVAGLKELAYQSDPATSIPKLEEAHLAMQQFLGGLAERRRLRNESEDISNIIELALKDMSPKLQYTKDLKSRLANSKTMASTEDKEALGNQQLRNLQTEVSTANSNPEFLDSKEQALRLAQENETKRATLLGKQLELAKTYIANAKQAVEDADGDENLITELVGLKDMAKASLKDLQLDKAEREIALIRTRANVVIRNPYGAALGSRKQLASNLEIYESSVSEFKEIVRGLAGIIKKLNEENVTPESIESVGEATKRLAIQFSAGDAAEPIKTLTTKGTSKEDMRKAREEILSVMRREAKKLTENPLIEKLQNNTIDPVAIPQSLKKLANSIDRIIGNTLRSVQ